MADNGDGFRRIAEWHVPNRVIFARNNKIPLAEFWTYIPTRCHWCKRVRKPTELELTSASHLRCINRRECEKIRTGKEPQEAAPPPPNGATKKVVVRRK